MAWVVHGSAVLMDKNQPACINYNQPIACNKASNVAYFYPQKYYNKTKLPLPDVVLSLEYAKQLGLLTTVGELSYASGHHLYELCDYRHLVSYLPLSLVHALSHAIQLMRWRDDHRFCSRCGTPTAIDPHEYASSCPACHHKNYPRIMPCVISAITRQCPTTAKSQILLALHHRHANTGMYGLIAGFVEIGESLETAVMREVQEETALSVKNIRYVTSQPWPYPTNLMVGFVAQYDQGVIQIDENELSHAQFFDIDKLPKIPQVGTIARFLIDHVVLR